jgi:hypothetical protein
MSKYSTPKRNDGFVPGQLEKKNYNGSMDEYFDRIKGGDEDLPGTPTFEQGGMFSVKDRIRMGEKNGVGNPNDYRTRIKQRLGRLPLGERLQNLGRVSPAQRKINLGRVPIEQRRMNLGRESAFQKEPSRFDFVPAPVGKSSTIMGSTPTPIQRTGVAPKIGAVASSGATATSPPMDTSWIGKLGDFATRMEGVAQSFSSLSLTHKIVGEVSCLFNGLETLKALEPTISQMATSIAKKMLNNFIQNQMGGSVAPID